MHNYEKHPPIGIDLGTSNSAIAAWVNAPNRLGAFVYHLNMLGYQRKDNRLTPSVVCRETGGDGAVFIVGQAAYRKRFSEPGNVALAVKRKIGDAGANIRLGDETFSAIELASEIVKGLFQDPLSVGLANPAGVVVATPYDFKQPQNLNTRQAVENALAETFAALPENERPKLLSLLPEPVAAALDYAFEHIDFPLDQVVLVFDLGGGTLDLTLIRLQITGAKIDFEVLASEGSAQFGGEDFDDVAEQFIEQRAGISYKSLNEKEKQRQKRIVRDAVMAAKEELSFKERAMVVGEMLLPNGDLLDVGLTRRELETLLSGNGGASRDFGAEVEMLIDNLLEKAKISAAAVDLILPIGGSTQIPFFSRILNRRFPKAKYFPSEEARAFGVAKGAALYAAYLLQEKHDHGHLGFAKKIRLVERAGHGLGIEKYNGHFSILVPENAVVPAVEEKIFVPTAYADKGRRMVKLSEIRIYQGGAAKAEQNTYIGNIPTPTIHAHGRALEDIPVMIQFEASATTVDVRIRIPNGTESGEDIDLCKNIRLQGEKVDD